MLLQDPAHAGTFLAPVTYATPGRLDRRRRRPADHGGQERCRRREPRPGGTGSISVLLHDPAHPGALLAATNYAGFGQPLGVALGDLNGDGRPDIAAADAHQRHGALQSATQPGTFAPAKQVGQ